MKVDAIMAGVQNTYEPIKSVRENVNVENDKAAKAAEKTKADAEKVASEVYGDVLSKSVDGDVTTAAKQSIDALSDGLVLPKENTPEVTTSLKAPVANPAVKQETEAEKLAEETRAEEDSEEEIGSLTGYTSNELETLYAQGKISRYDYDQEVARRAELSEQDKPETQAEKTEDTAAEEKNEEQANIIKQQIEGNQAFNKEMSELTNTAINTDMSVDALNIARQNDRVELIGQILGQNN